MYVFSLKLCLIATLWSVNNRVSLLELHMHKILTSSNGTQFTLVHMMPNNLRATNPYLNTSLCQYWDSGLIILVIVYILLMFGSNRQVMLTEWLRITWTSRCCKSALKGRQCSRWLIAWSTNYWLADGKCLRPNHTFDNTGDKILVIKAQSPSTMHSKYI